MECKQQNQIDAHSDQDENKTKDASLETWKSTLNAIFTWTKVAREGAASHQTAQEILSPSCSTDQPVFLRTQPRLGVLVPPPLGWLVWHEKLSLSSPHGEPRRRKCAVLHRGRVEAGHFQVKSSIDVCRQSYSNES